MALPQWMVLRNAMLGATKSPEAQAAEDQKKALADAKLMADVPAVAELNPSAAYMLDLNRQVSGASSSARSSPMPERVARPEFKLEQPKFQPVPELDMSVPDAGTLPALDQDQPVDWSARVQGARGDADRVRLAAGIGRAGEAVNAALGGRKSDGSAYNGLDAHANSIEERPDVDVKIDEMSRKYREAAQLRDPKSPINVRYRAGVPNAFRTVIPDFENRTAKEIADAVPVLQKGFDSTIKRIKESNAIESERVKAANSFNKDTQAFADSQDRLNLDFDRQANPQAVSPLLINNTSVEARNVGAAMEKAAEKLRVAAPVIGSLRGIEAIAPGLITKADASGGLGFTEQALRRLPAGLGSRLSDEQKMQLQTKFDEVMLAYRNRLFGASVTANEQAAIDAAAGSGLFSNPDVQALFLNVMARKLTQEVRAIGSPYRTSERSNMRSQWALLEDDNRLSFEKDPFLGSLWSQMQPKGYGAPAAPTRSGSTSAPQPPPGPKAPGVMPEVPPGGRKQENPKTGAVRILDAQGNVIWSDR